MGILDFFKNKDKKKTGLRNAQTMSGGLPFFAPFGDNLYASDIIVQSIRCKANEFKKLEPRHIRETDNEQIVIKNSSIAKILKRPNEYMSAADFLEKITILLELNKNVFIYPSYYMAKSGEKVYTGLYPLKPSEVAYLSDDGGKMYLNLKFLNGYEVTLPADEVVHWRKDYGVNDYFGGGMFGGNDDTGLLTMLKRYDQLTQSIAVALECSCKVNGVVRYNSYNDTDELQAKREEFEKNLQSNSSGVLFTDLKTEYTHIPRDIKLVDSETLKFFYDTILRANGTSLAILNGDYSKAQKEAYYEHTLEADIKSLGQALSRCLFSRTEVSFGNEIILYPNDIAFMSMENKLTALQVGLPAGIFTRNEARRLLGYPPIENGNEIPQGYNNTIQTDEKGNDEQ